MNPEIVTRGPVSLLSVSGKGEPGGTEYVGAVTALYTVAAAMGTPMGALEGRWWVEESGGDPFAVPRSDWRWHLDLPLDGPPPAGALERAREAVRGSGAAVDRVQVVSLAEGQCVELVHDGPFSEEERSLKVMEEFMAARGLVRNGPHHEVYLTPPEDPSPRTLLRQPVR